MGIRLARGNIIALVDDDAFWPATTVLPYLLAGLEDPKVGAVQGKQRYLAFRLFHCTCWQSNLTQNYSG